MPARTPNHDPDEDALLLEEIEVLPLPGDKATRMEPFWLETQPDAWPNQRLRFTFDWNNAMSKWVWSVEHVGNEMIVNRAPIYPGKPVTYRDYIFMMFFSPSGKVDEVTPADLGDRIRLGFYPLPDSPAFEYPF